MEEKKEEEEEGEQEQREEADSEAASGSQTRGVAPGKLISARPTWTWKHIRVRLETTDHKPHERRRTDGRTVTPQRYGTHGSREFDGRTNTSREGVKAKALSGWSVQNPTAIAERD
mmetsp:Transcript_80214/g.175935  ORF Transcript_80214/g.175935 Transcript_80214/m.175935 type:complete len:116 (-) Transcript_80214:45-392(-)